MPIINTKKFDIEEFLEPGKMEKEIKKIMLLL